MDGSYLAMDGPNFSAGEMIRIRIFCVSEAFIDYMIQSWEIFLPKASQIITQSKSYVVEKTNNIRPTFFFF